MRKFLLLCLLSPCVWADVILKADAGTVTVGPVTSIACGVGLVCTRSGTTGTLTPELTQTYAAMTLYVDANPGVGSDSNNCTSSATACLTAQGAIGKLPRFIQHTVTINFAAGTYAGFSIINLTIGNLNASGGSLDLVGAAQIAATVATGTASGTSTGYTAPVVSTTFTEGTLSDTTQTWTVSNLKGLFLEATNGVAVGKRVAIIDNTADTITIGGPLTGFVLGDTYAIKTPASIFSSTAVFTSVSGSGALTATDLKFTGLSLIGTLSVTNNSTSMSFKTCINTAATSIMFGSKAQSASTTPSIFSAGMSIFEGRFFCGAGSFIRHTSSNVLQLASGGLTTAHLQAGSSAGACTVEAPAGSVAGIYLVSSRASVDATTIWIRGTSNSYGVYAAPGSVYNSTLTRVDTTTNGFVLDAATVAKPAAQSVDCRTTTTCVSTQNGAKARINTLTTATTTDDVNVDGTAYTKAAVLGFTPTSVLGAKGSSFSIGSSP